jgi:hypothetical protein
MGNGEDVASGAVVFVCDRQGAALQRRERCLKLAGIPYGIHSEDVVRGSAPLLLRGPKPPPPSREPRVVPSRTVSAAPPVTAPPRVAGSA